MSAIIPPDDIVPLFGSRHAGHPVRIDEMTDAAYCATCVEWLEPPCGDVGCMYCCGRPARPPVGLR